MPLYQSTTRLKNNMLLYYQKASHCVPDKKKLYWAELPKRQFVRRQTDQNQLVNWWYCGRTARVYLLHTVCSADSGMLACLECGNLYMEMCLVCSPWVGLIRSWWFISFTYPKRVQNSVNLTFILWIWIALDPEEAWGYLHVETKN
jgi:hypothetical protein